MNAPSPARAPLGRKRLAAKGQECEDLRAEAERRTALVASLQHDRDRLTAALAAAKERLQRVTAEGVHDEARAPAAWAVDASKVRVRETWLGLWSCCTSNPDAKR